jgi:hypothetical protein
MPGAAMKRESRPITSLGAVAGDALEGGIDVFDRAVAAVDAGDDDAVAGRMQGALAQAQCAFLVAPGRDVHAHAEQVAAAVAIHARAAQQHRRFASAARDDIGFDRDFLAVLEHAADALGDQGTGRQVEQFERIGRAHFFRAVLGHPLMVAVPEQEAAIAVERIEGARQDVDDRRQRHAPDQPHRAWHRYGCCRWRPPRPGRRRRGRPAAGWRGPP